MIQSIDDLDWISQWRKKHCDGDCGEGGFKIYSISNPGWTLEINLFGTNAETLSFESGLVENGVADWYMIRVQNGKFQAYGDLMKLNFMVKSFREMMEKCGETI